MEIAIRSLALIVFSSALGLGINYARPNGVPLSGPTLGVTCSSEGVVREVSAEEAKQSCGQTGFAVLDTRSEDDYARGHIVDAIHLPCDSQGKIADVATQTLSGKQTLLVYGDSTAQARAVGQSLAQRLPSTTVLVLRDGFAAWQKAGLACSSGLCDACSSGSHP